MVHTAPAHFPILLLKDLCVCCSQLRRAVAAAAVAAVAAAAAAAAAVVVRWGQGVYGWGGGPHNTPSIRKLRKYIESVICFK